MRSMVLAAFGALVWAGILWPCADLQAAEIEIEIRNGRFVPEVVHARPGDVLTWRNLEGTHNVVADDGRFNSGPLRGGRWTYSYTVGDVPGEQLYRSQTAAGMTGAIVTLSERVPIGARVNGTWWIPGSFGQALMLEYVPSDDALFVAWYTYDASGKPSWAAGAAPLDPSHRVTVPLVQFADGSFLAPGARDAIPWGSVELQFKNCNQGQLYWQRIEPAAEGSIAIERLHPLETCF